MANKRQRKKRIKKLAQMKAIKLIEVTQVTIKTVVPDTVTEPPTAELCLGKYEAQNKEYQSLLDKRYPEGRIHPVERYINDQASILHHCTKCGTNFYGKPIYILGEDHQKHICSMPYGDKDGERLEKVGGKNKTKKKETLNVNQFYNLVWNDYTYQQIAKELKINPNIVKDYFKAEGLI